MSTSVVRVLAFAAILYAVSANLHPAVESTEFMPVVGGRYLLHTSYRGPSRCLVSSKMNVSSLTAPLYMGGCTRDALWEFVYHSPGYYWLRSSDGRCAEGSSMVVGASYVDHCRNVQGQLWRIVTRNHVQGHFTLTNMWREKKGECLEGGSISTAAYMAHCAPYGSQLFCAERIAHA